MTTAITATALTEIYALLVDLAGTEEALAHSEAAAVPYWAPTPESVVGHRLAAVALRARAEALGAGAAA
ncbi:MAG TPA: hypothetical protein VJ872_04175 [Nocardioides sp.]|nr:hypothetical protein [Nocardioides sp.]